VHIRERLAYWICLWLKSKLETLRRSNTKVMPENGRQIKISQRPVFIKNDFSKMLVGLVK
jgi:hypothetical protein